MGSDGVTKPHFRRLADGTTVLMHDGLVNVAANLGTARDKASYSTYAMTLLDRQQLLTAYRTSWLPQAIVDIPALDCVRKWRAWQAEKPQIAAIEAEEKRLNLRETVHQGITAARLFGGACIYIGTGDASPAEPLKADRIAAQGLSSLTVLTPNQITPDEINRDIDSGYYGRPEFYNLAGERGQVRIHASRLVVIQGIPQPDLALATDGWGDSVLLAAMEAIKQADGASANIASLLFEAKIDVFRFMGMGQLFETPEGNRLMGERLSATATLKGINGAVVLDKEDEYEQKNASFGGLDAIWDRFMLNVSGAARIPVTRLFGRSAAGLSGSGEGDERVYFDRIQAMQELELQPAMSMLDECLIRSALGARPAEVYYRWNPLRQISETERATIFKTTADGARAMAGNGGTSPALLPLEALSDALVNELTEQGVLPGLEGKIEEYGTLAENMPDQDDMTAAMGGQQRPNLRIVGDAEPRTLYVSRNVLNADEIIAWAKGQGFKTTLPADDLHVTIAYSRTPLDWMKVGESWQGKVELAEGGPRLMEKFGEARVLLFKASELEWRHDAIKEAGASWDHPDYQPHISISYSPDSPDLENVTPYQGKIILGPEIFAEVNEDWSAGIKET